MKRTLLLMAILCCLMQTALRAQLAPTYTTLSPYGSTWKYLDSTNPGTAWIAPGFNDSAWSSGAAFLGYGDPWMVTCIRSGCGGVQCTPTCGTKTIGYFFRKTITLPSLAGYDSVRVSAKRDDGIVVYLNGAEVWRNNMPTGTIAYNTPASTTVDGVAETTAVSKTFPVSAFLNGANSFAVEVHQSGATSSDLTFDLAVEGVKYVPVAAAITQGPYLQVGNQSGVTVRWRTNYACASSLKAGSAPGSYTLTGSDPAKVTEHILRLNGLSADTKYFYQVGTDTSVLQGDSANFFTTAPADTTSRKVTVALYGDCGRNDLNFQTNTLASYLYYLKKNGRKAADLLLLNGDNAYNSGTDAEYTSQFFNPYSGSILKNHMLFPSPGNHEYNNGQLAAQLSHNIPYYSLFSMPSAGESGGVPSNTKAFYSYDWGNIHFLSLDSYGLEDTANNTGTRLYDTNGRQVTWIKADLAANTKKWVVCYWHHPPFSMGSHNSDNETELVKIRQNFIRILERYGVDLVVCGHSHDYERSYLLKNYYGNEAAFNKPTCTADSSSAKYDGSQNSCPYLYNSGKYSHGTVYVVAGSSGANDGIQAGYPHDALPYAYHDGGMLYLEIQGNRLDAKYIRRDSTVADQFTIMKDAVRRDTLSIIRTQQVALTAAFQSSYNWSDGSTGRTIVAAPVRDSLITVKDSLTNTCLSNSFFVQVTPDTFTLARNFGDTLLCAGDSVRVGYYTNLPFQPGSTMTLQLSDGSGSFANALSIGATATPTGRITAVVPSGTVSGSQYQVRVLSTSRADTSDNFYNSRIRVDNISALTATSDSTLCSGDTLHLNASAPAGGIRYSWSGPNSYQDSGRSVLRFPVSLADSGRYILNARLNACRVLDTVQVQVRPTPAVPLASGNGPICAKDTLRLTATDSTTGVSYSWTGPNGYTASVQNPVIGSASLSDSGDYVSIVTLGSCSARDTVRIQVRPTPAAPNASGNGPLCAQSPIRLTATDSTAGVSYGWTGPNGYTASTQNPVIGSASLTDSGDYVSIVTLGSCSAKDTVHVSVRPNPARPVISGRDSVCDGSPLTLVATDSVSNVSFSWTGPNGASILGATVNVPAARASDSGIYRITATLGICSAADSIRIRVLPLVTPSVSITAQPSVVIRSAPATYTAIVVNGGGSTQYQWYSNGVAVAGATASVYTTTSAPDSVTVRIVAPQPCTTNDTAFARMSSQSSTSVGGTAVRSARYSVYPNPSSGMLYIDRAASGASEELTLRLYDAQGTTVLERRFTLGSDRQAFQLDVPAGNYFLQLSGANGSEAYRLIITR